MRKYIFRTRILCPSLEWTLSSAARAGQTLGVNRQDIPKNDRKITFPSWPHFLLLHDARAEELHSPGKNMDSTMRASSHTGTSNAKNFNLKKQIRYRWIGALSGRPSAADERHVALPVEKRLQRESSIGVF